MLKTLYESVSKAIQEDSIEKNSLCLKCQKCCKQIYVAIQLPSDNRQQFYIREFYSARGIKLKQHDGVTYLIIPHKCPHLTPKGCDCYHNRPEACFAYDGRNDPFLKDDCLWNSIPSKKEN